jgi:hypothetical protein
MGLPNKVPEVIYGGPRLEDFKARSPANVDMEYRVILGITNHVIIRERLG